MVGELTSYWLARGRGVVLGAIEGGVVYDPLVTAYLARRESIAPSSYNAAVNSTVVAIRAAGYLPKLTALYLARDPVSRVDARLNVLAAANDLTESGNITFAMGKGFTGDGATAYLDTGYVVPAPSQNSFHVGFGSDSSQASATNEVGTDANLIIQTRTSPSDGVLARINTTTSSTGTAQLNGAGHYVISRTGSNASALYQGGVSRVAANVASAAPTATTLRFLGRSGSTSSGKRMNFGHFGAGLSAAEVQSITDIIFQNYTRPLGLDIACYGDSLTAGNASGAGTPYPETLATLSGRTVFNGGVGGQTTSQIKTRWDADYGGKYNAFVLWTGRNDVGALPSIYSNVAAMIARSEATIPGRYLLLGVTNGWTGTEDVGSGPYTEILTYNSTQATTYGSRFFDVRAYLYGLGAPGQPYDDPTAYAAGLIPTALRADASVHINGVANDLVAQQVYAKGQSLGYWT